MRRIGFVSAAALAICLGAMVMAMAGGPTAPFAEWAAPRAPAATAHDGSAARAPAHSTTSPSPELNASGAHVIGSMATPRRRRAGSGTSSAV